jgi:hypothetical protein
MFGSGEPNESAGKPTKTMPCPKESSSMLDYRAFEVSQSFKSIRPRKSTPHQFRQMLLPSRQLERFSQTR